MMNKLLQHMMDAGDVSHKFLVNLPKAQGGYTFPTVKQNGLPVFKQRLQDEIKKMKKTPLPKPMVRSLPLETIDARKKAFNTIRPSDYFDVPNYTRFLSNTQRSEFEDPRSEEAFKLYLGLENNPQYFRKSKYKPTINPTPGETYFSADPEMEQDIFDTYSNQLKLNESRAVNEVSVPSYFPEDTPGLFEENGKQWVANVHRDHNLFIGRPYNSRTHALGNFTVSRGKDKKGDYLSYYDQYDFPETMQKQMKGEPYKVYGRVYYPKKEMGGTQYFADGGKYKGQSIVDYLATKGYSGKKAFRKDLAEKYGVEGYDYSAAKNTELMNRMQENDDLLETYKQTMQPIPVQRMMEMERQQELRRSAPQNTNSVVQARNVPQVENNVPQNRGEIKRNQQVFPLPSNNQELPTFAQQMPRMAQPAAPKGRPLIAAPVNRNYGIPGWDPYLQQHAQQSKAAPAAPSNSKGVLPTFQQQMPRVATPPRPAGRPLVLPPTNTNYGIPGWDPNLQQPVQAAPQRTATPASNSNVKLPGYAPPVQSQDWGWDEVPDNESFFQFDRFPRYPDQPAKAPVAQPAAAPDWRYVQPGKPIPQNPFQQFPAYPARQVSDLPQKTTAKAAAKNLEQDIEEESWFEKAGSAIEDGMEYASGLFNGLQRKWDSTQKEDPRSINRINTPIKIDRGLPGKTTGNKKDSASAIPYGYKQLYAVADSKNPKDSLVSFMNTFDNEQGGRYYIGHKAKEVTDAGAQSSFDNAEGVAHFLRDSDILPGQKITPKSWEVSKGYTYHTTSPGKTVSAAGLDDPNKYRMLYRPNPKNDGTYLAKYVRNKEISPIREAQLKQEGWEQDFTVNAQHKFSDIAWEKDGPSTGYAAASKWLPLKDGKHTYIPYKSKDGFSRFSGGSGIYLFKDPKTGKQVGVDVSGSVNTIKKIGDELIKSYGVKPEELELAYHDMGSYSAKPKSHNGKLDYKQWLDYNTYNRGFSGAPMVIPRKNNGGPIIDPRGQWAHPGKVTRIPSNQITMQGVPYPVYAKPNNGQGRMMYPNQDYNFGGASYVDEYPMMQKGGSLPAYQIKGQVAPSYTDNTRVAKPMIKNPIGFANDPDVIKYNKIKNDPSWGEPYKFLMNWYAHPETQKRLKAQGAPARPMTEALNQKLYDNYYNWYSESKNKNIKGARDVWGDNYSRAKDLSDVLNKDLDSRYDRLSNNTSGFHIASDSVVALNNSMFSNDLIDKLIPTPTEDMSTTAVHELTHATPLDNFYVDYFKKNKPKNPSGSETQYFSDKPREIYPRIQDLRYQMWRDKKIAPGTRITPEMLDGYDNNSSQNIRNYYSPQELSKIMNEIASTSSAKRPMTQAQYGGGLLSKTVSCSSCGHSWKSVDGGGDLLHCHNCGGMVKMQNGGYTVTSSSDRKGKTHKVTGPDGTIKYFGDSTMGQHPKDPERKAAFYARHKSNLEGNPFFRAFARATWADGGQTNLPLAQDGWVQRAASANLNFWEKCGLASNANNGGGGSGPWSGGGYKSAKYKNPYEELSDIDAYDKDERKSFKSSLPQGVDIKDWVAFNRDASRMNSLLSNPDYDKYVDSTGTLKQEYQNSATQFDPYYLYYKPAFMGKKSVTPTEIMNYHMNQPHGISGYKDLANRRYMPQKYYGGNIYKSGGEMIRRADGSYSPRGMWDNIRDNKGSGKQPTKEMLQQERKIKSKNK